MQQEQVKDDTDVNGSNNHEAVCALDRVLNAHCLDPHRAALGPHFVRPISWIQKAEFNFS
jgi:hypothetical protein